MSDSGDSEQNKSEQPTPFKLTKARQKGSVARGMDLGFLVSLTAFLAYGWLLGPKLAAQITQAARAALITAPQVAAGPDALFALTGQMAAAAARPLAFMTAVIFLAVLVFEVIQTGLVFSTEPLRLDFGKLNPAKGLKRVFSWRMLIETAKNILKLTVYASLAALVVMAARGAIPTITDAASLAAALNRTGLRLLTVFVAAAAVFAALDQLIVRRDFLKKMRMSRREVRRESRDREGEPRMKQRRKQLHREYIQQSRSLRGVKGADMLIANPTHYAVALKYDTGTMIAPTVVGLGSGPFAQRLKRLAFLHGVTIIEDPVLARELHARCPLGGMIPEGQYRRVADHYQALRRRSREQAGSQTDV